MELRADHSNWLIFLLYTRGETEDCLKQIAAALELTEGQGEFPNFIKGLVLRKKGKLPDSNACFKKAFNYRASMSVAKQMGRCSFLLGKAAQAISFFDRCLTQGEDDWELYYLKGMSLSYKGETAQAIECFRTANLIEKHDATYMELGRVYSQQNDVDAAIDTYQDALSYSLENTEVLTKLGLMYLSRGNKSRALEYFGSALSLDKKNSEALIASGCILQEGNEHDAALIKYRIIAAQHSNSSKLWNNIGMCFFDKGKYIASIACLKRSLYLDPLQPEVCYNLGLVHLTTTQYASAFIYFKSAISLDPFMAKGYMCLGITLSRLNDFGNAIAAYEKSNSLENSQVTSVNLAFALVKAGQIDKARIYLSSLKVTEAELLGKLDHLRRLVA
jgi:Bardet-Biedl syndrome 4 protein